MPFNQYTPFATTLQPTDLLLIDQDTGQTDSAGNKIYVTKGIPGKLFEGGNGAVLLMPNAILGNPGGSNGSNFGQPIMLDPQDFTIDAGGTLRGVFSLADGLAAQGSTQADALPLGARTNIITVTAPGSGVIAPPLLTGQYFRAFNLGAHPLNLYPLGGGIIGLGGQVNAAVSIFPNTSVYVLVRSGLAGQTQLLLV